jgi:hypothetical protein
VLGIPKGSIVTGVTGGIAKVSSSLRNLVLPADAPGSGTYPTECDAPEAPKVVGTSQEASSLRNLTIPLEEPGSGTTPAV